MSIEKGKFESIPEADLESAEVKEETPSFQEKAEGKMNIGESQEVVE